MSTQMYLLPLPMYPQRLNDRRECWRAIVRKLTARFTHAVARNTLALWLYFISLFPFYILLIFLLLLLHSVRVFVRSLASWHVTAVSHAAQVSVYRCGNWLWMYSAYDASRWENVEKYTNMRSERRIHRRSSFSLFSDVSAWGSVHSKHSTHIPCLYIFIIIYL